MPLSCECEVCVACHYAALARASDEAVATARESLFRRLLAPFLPAVSRDKDPRS